MRTCWRSRPASCAPRSAADVIASFHVKRRRTSQVDCGGRWASLAVGRLRASLAVRGAESRAFTRRCPRKESGSRRTAGSQRGVVAATPRGDEPERLIHRRSGAWAASPDSVPRRGPRGARPAARRGSIADSFAGRSGGRRARGAARGAGAGRVRRGTQARALSRARRPRPTLVDRTSPHVCRATARTPPPRSCAARSYTRPHSPFLPPQGLSHEVMALSPFDVCGRVRGWSARRKGETGVSRETRLWPVPKPRPPATALARQRCRTS